MCQCRLGTILPVSLGNNRASFTWEQFCQTQLGAVVSDRADVTWKKSCQFNLETMVPVSLGNNCASVLWEQSCKSHQAIILPVSLGNKLSSVT